MAKKTYARKKSSHSSRSGYSRSGYAKSRVKRTSGRKLTSSRRSAPQTVRIVVEQVAPQAETSFLTGVKTQPLKTARF